MFLPNPYTTGRMWLKINLRGVKLVWIQFSFSYISRLTNAKEHSLPYYLPIAAGENRWVHAFPKDISLKWNEKALSRIWTLVANSISFDNKDYEMNALHKKVNSLTLLAEVLSKIFTV